MQPNDAIWITAERKIHSRGITVVVYNENAPNAIYIDHLSPYIQLFHYWRAEGASRAKRPARYEKDASTERYSTTATRTNEQIGQEYTTD